MLVPFYISVILIILFIFAKHDLGMLNGVGKTPMMGWMAWQRFRCNIDCNKDANQCVSEKLIKDMADRLVLDGWKDLGYKYVSIDDCWQANERASDGSIQPNSSRFPSGMKALGDYIHSKGLKFGMYTAMGLKTCQGYPAFGCNDVDSCKKVAYKDIQTYLSWGIDYIKVDSCKGANLTAFNVTHPLVSNWLLEGSQKMNRPVLYHPSGITLTPPRFGAPIQYKLYSKIANMWRHYGDIQPAWKSVIDIIEFWAADNNASHELHYPGEWEDFLSVSRPGLFQDPDALLIGNVKGPKMCDPCTNHSEARPCIRSKACICCGSLTFIEEQTQMALWALWAAPLEIGADLRIIPEKSSQIMKNAEVIAVNQDPLGYQGRRIMNVDGKQIWKKELADSSVAVVLFNSNNASMPVQIPIKFVDIGFSPVDHILVRDILQHQDKGVFTDSYVSEKEIPPHGVLMFKLSIE